MVLTAAAGVTVSSAAAVATAELYATGAIGAYALGHIFAALLHLYALTKRPVLRRLALSIEQVLCFFIVALLLILSGFSSPLFIYALFMGLVCNVLRDTRY